MDTLSGWNILKYFKLKQTSEKSQDLWENKPNCVFYFISCTFWKMSLSSIYLNTVMKLVSLSSTSFSVIPFADFFSRLSQYFASCTSKRNMARSRRCESCGTCSVCVFVCTHEFRGFTDGLWLPKVHHRCQSLRKVEINTFSQIIFIVKINEHVANFTFDTFMTAVF